MADYQQDKGRGTTFGRSLMRYIGSKLPYNSIETINNINEINPKYKLFYDNGTKSCEDIYGKNYRTVLKNLFKKLRIER